MLLGLDLGTTNVKAVLTERDGRIIGRGSAPVSLLHVGEVGVEQDIEEIWSATVTAIAEIAQRHDLSGVQAVGVSSQGGAMQVLSGDGEPVGKVISWLDGRGRPYDDDLTRKLGPDWFAERTGHGASGLAAGQVLRLRDECPAVPCSTSKVSFVGDIIVSRLCGRAAHDASSLSICVLFNPRLRGADPDMLEALHLAEEQLPDLIPPREPAGTLREEAAQATSLPVGIPVSAAVHDQYASALGAGATHAGDVAFGTGTAWVLLAMADRLARPVVDAAFVCTHLIDGLYGQMVALGNGGSSFEWATRLLGLDGHTTDDIDNMLGEIPVGSEGVRFWPLLAAFGGWGLAPGTHGRLFGLRLSHGPGHMLRAVIEGLALELGRYLRFLARRGIAFKRLLMSGGATASRITPQIISDVTGLPVSCTTETEMSALGAAVLARGLVETSADLAALAESMKPAVRVFEPGPHGEFYGQMLDEYIASLPKEDS